MKEDEDIYMAVVERIRLMALMHLLHFYYVYMSSDGPPKRDSPF